MGGMVAMRGDTVERRKPEGTGRKGGGGKGVVGKDARWEGRGGSRREVVSREMRVGRRVERRSVVTTKDARWKGRRGNRVVGREEGRMDGKGGRGGGTVVRSMVAMRKDVRHKGGKGGHIDQLLLLRILFTTGR